MKNRMLVFLKWESLGLMLFLALPFIGKSQSIGKTELPVIRNGFYSIPDSIQTSVYWYWLSDNISKEGVIKDLQAMKQVGINRAFIGNIGLGPDDVPYGKVKIFSDEWWDILHTALKTASELNIQIGIFNSPGWSQSGGPWIKPEQAMRYLTTSELRVSGPQKLNATLVRPAKNFQDVKVIAFRAPKSEVQINSSTAQITSIPEVSNIANIADQDLTTEVLLPSGNNQPVNLTVDFRCEKEQTIRSISIFTAHRPMGVHADLFAKEGNDFRLIKSIDVDRSNPNLIVGFNPYGPVVISLPETKSDVFRLVFSNASSNSGIAEVCLSSEPREERYVEKSLAKMFQTPHPMWKDYMWKDQPEVTDKSLLINPKEVVDLSKQMTEDGNLTWDVPEGDWIILRTGMTPTGVKNEPATPEGTGLEVDKMSKKLVAEHFDAFLGEIIKRIPAEDRKTWKFVVEDSYERGGENWTDGFISDFKNRYGYDPVSFIPVLQGNVVGSQDLSDRFLWDLRRMVADKVAYDYVGGLRAVSHKNGMTTWLENYGHWGFPSEFLLYGSQSDEIGGEFWSEGELGDIENRAASSCAHTYGKRKASAESFTCAGAPFSRYPAQMKPRGDRFFTEGINNTLFHVYIEQPYGEDKLPGVNAWFGNEFNRNNTWFSDLDLFTKYMKRCDFMLQQGRYVADAAYFIGEDAPKMIGVCDPALPKGYSFDYINGEVLRDRASVKDGRLTLPDGMSYRILVLPKQETMRPELLNKIYKLVRDGAVVLGPAPKRSPSMQNYPAADLAVQKMASKLWGKVDGVHLKYAKVGKGMILSGMSMEDALKLASVMPDCKTEPSDPVLFIHRQTKDADIYFISNQSNQTIKINPEFRVAGKVPELWNPVTGETRSLPAYDSQKEKTKIPLKLEANESAFIVFKNGEIKPASTNLEANFPTPKIVVAVDAPWSVQFDEAHWGPKNPVVFDKLTDWTASDNDSIRYYSGTAVYHTEFDLPNGIGNKNLFLNLGSLSAMAKVKINGKEVGGVWTAPWQVNISSAVKEGKNEVEIEVVNTWMNRLIGDRKLPKGQSHTWCTVNPYTTDSALEPSGLLGPVTIEQMPE